MFTFLEKDPYIHYMYSVICNGGVVVGYDIISVQKPSFYTNHENVSNHMYAVYVYPAMF